MPLLFVLDRERMMVEVDVLKSPPHHGISLVVSGSLTPPATSEESRTEAGDDSPSPQNPEQERPRTVVEDSS